MTRRPVRETAALLALMLTLSACGADAPDESGSEVEAAEVGAEAAAAPEPDLSDDEEAGEDEAGEDEAVDHDTADEDDTADETSTEDDASAADGMGVVTVDGQTYEVTELRNCDPLDDGTIERSLELQGIGTQDGERFQIDVYQADIAGMPFDDVAWSGPEGIFGAEDAQISLDEDGRRVSGTAALLDAMSQTEAVDLEFDLEVPAETIPCR